ncbi:hypothetical protein T12_4292 [Trichinella patagoniensis]|uniref:Uncharacterized protein n=1 Tax=Trichinella patagoniensis TaxID=990121 RepID=A0A0V1ACW7_9BILA|nr:hypothetical protein T12_4292 [Trichinella patagoniensis]
MRREITLATLSIHAISIPVPPSPIIPSPTVLMSLGIQPSAAVSWCMISSAYPDFPPLTLEYSRHHQLAGTVTYGIPINQLHILSQRRTVPSGSALQYEEDKVTSLLSNYLTAQNLPFFPNTYSRDHHLIRFPQIMPAESIPRLHSV